jgi:hypothetical protein
MAPIGLSNDDLIAVVGRSRRTIERSHGILTAGQVRIAACARRLLPRLRGGSLDRAEPQEHRIHAFLAALPKEKPRIYAGKSDGGRTCDACRRPILLGASEYEAEFQSVIFRLDRDCFVACQAALLSQ